MGAIPAARRLSMAALTAGKSASQTSGSGNESTEAHVDAAMSKLPLSSRTRSTPASQSLSVESMQSSPHCEKTWMAMIRASRATPENSPPVAGRDPGHGGAVKAVVEVRGAGRPAPDRTDP